MKRLLPLFSLLLIACGGSGSGAVVRFGAAGPWDEAYGAMNRRGIELAYDQIKARPDYAQHPVEIDWQNDHADGEEATNIAHHFVTDPAVVAVIGHVNSGTEVAAAKIYDAGHLVSMATTATSPALTGISPWVFRVISSDSMNGLHMAKFAGTRLGERRAAVLYENNAYGRGLADAFRRNFTGTVLSFDPIAADSQNFEPYVSYIKGENPDLVFVAGTDASGRAFVNEVRRQKFGVTLLGGDGWTGLSVDTTSAEGVFVGAPFSAENPDPGAQKFVHEFRAKFGLTPDGNAALAYDATNLLYEALTRVGPDRAKIRDYLAGLNAASAFKGVTGNIYFGANGDPVGKTVVMTMIHNGALRVVEGSP
ncbi:MAG TPA: ABC transporter substrate-binding protein [Gemmatimonadaceae bacterium]|nr:ABC transporter substrate-binding protein [Gemmatimonadaceae bacterium]